MIQATQAVTRSWGGSSRDFLRAVFNFLNGIRIGEVAVDLPNIALNATVDVAAIALPAGTAAIGDLVEVVAPATLNHGLLIQSSRIAVADQLTMRVSNVTGAGIDAGLLTFTYKIWKITGARPVTG